MPELIPPAGPEGFTDYLWRNTRSSVLLSWAMIVAVSILAYSGILVVLKNRQLHSSLKIAAETVHESLQAGDWPLALGHLRSLERSGHAFQITLKNKARGTDLSGPFGSKPFGVGSLCAEESVDGQSSLTGCMRVLGATEVYTLAFFLVFSGGVFLVALRFFQTKMRFFVKKVSDELGRIPALDAKRENAVGSGESGILEVDAIRTHIYELLKKIEKASASQALAQMSVQVAHDIRSPLAALEAASGDVAQLPEDKRVLIRSAAGRIRDIANDLLDRHRRAVAGSPDDETGRDNVSGQLLSSLIDPVVSEKRLQFRSRPGIEIEAVSSAAGYGLFAQVQLAEFKRVLSNLINNAVEALEESAGVVRVGLSAREGRVLVSVEDNGKGIPPEILAKLGERGASYGKAGGSGLGLHHARTCAESWGGRLELASQSGRGTTVTLSLPQAAPPDWFVSELLLVPGKAVVILDDDSSIHKVWQGRVSAMNLEARGIELLMFSAPEQLKAWTRKHTGAAGEALYLLDYELLGHQETGLSLAEELGLAARTVLVTSRFEEASLLEECRKLQVHVIPKGLAAYVPIRVLERRSAGSERWDVVLIDDDPLVRRTWEMAAARVGKKVRAFGSAADFFKDSEAFDRKTPVYVDSSLADGEKGEEESRRIHELGFGEIYLATGYETRKSPALSHLRGVVGKDPPWNAS